MQCVTIMPTCSPLCSQQAQEANNSLMPKIIFHYSLPGGLLLTNTHTSITSFQLQNLAGTLRVAV